jgi:hypothetical protein
MIELLALAPEDGWAFVRSDGRIRLLRPPYGKRVHPEVAESEVARAVAVEGFEAADARFEDWTSIFAYLEKRFLASRPEPRREVTPEVVERILRHAPPDALEGFLDRIERELLPDGQWAPASTLLMCFLAVESTAAAPFRARAWQLLRRCQEEQFEAGKHLKDLAERVWAEVAPEAVERYGAPTIRAYRQRIQQARSFIPAA